MNLKKLIKAILPESWVARWRSWSLKRRSADKIFSRIYKTNYWGGAESKSGRGSDLIQTAVVIEELPKLLRRHSVESILDIPCGDFNWMQHVELNNVQYVGGDIVKSLIEENRKRFPGDKKFEVLDITKGALPKVDLIFCRDCLVHLSYHDIQLALNNVIKSGARYVLATSFYTRETNRDIDTGQWRPINLEKEPFNFPPPIDRIVENCTEGDGKFTDKSLMLWSVDSLSHTVFSRR